MGYDVIGDIHGHADKLVALLAHMGYRETRGAWRHRTNQAIFVGDFIDRGPAQIRSVGIVRRMVEAGSALAVMGNHELNAIAWHTPDARHAGQYLRPHDGPNGPKNLTQHRAFLAEVEDKPALHAEIIDWFLTLPLWLDLPDLCVVHACWHPRLMAWLSPQLHEGRYLTRELMVPATVEPEKDSDEGTTPTIFKAVEAVTKGIEVPLPAGLTFLDKDRHTRSSVRVRWWDQAATTYRAAAVMTGGEQAALPDSLIDHYPCVEATDKPVFFGHYWLTGARCLQSAVAACLDYSAGNGGPLVAYRFDGEQRLSPNHFVPSC